MCDRHGEDGTHEHGAQEQTAAPEIVKLRKMAEHWISHNEEHASSYRLWSGRSREMGHVEPADILEEIASKTVALNERLRKIVQIIDSGSRSD